ncbi:OmpA family protein [Lichenicoccus roseus]|uniref:OmpA family protein n=1 Tax=Lichenicoccus roseus TaxID=2683649 RepID=A0A5R9JAH8_9PROT|nr:OmpA family protein [Lichenicoccus roseus]TLU72376.1 OmpA family protein [Lichenicoccus roseus]
MRLRTALLATTLLAAAPVAAMAQPVAGPYVSLGAGYNLQQTRGVHYSPTTEADGTEGLGGSKSSIRFGDGFTGDGAVGFGFGNGLRTEIQGAYLYNNVNHRGGTPVAGDTSGRDEKYGAFVNVLYDLDLAQFGLALPVTPYVGIGAGYLWEHQGPLSTTYVVSSEDRTGGTQGSFAYQGIIGAAYNIEAVPGLAVTGEYRFVGTTPQTTGSAFSSTAYNPTGIHKGNADFNDSFNHEFLVGLRYAFDTAPPPPPPAPVAPAPAPAPARTYLVFFDWDKSALTGRAREIIAEAAQASTRVQTTRIEVNGYTDNSSIHGGERGARYNEGLSIRRADSVKAELVRDGVPATAIDIHGYGESHPLVPTGPNTREPQNRRVEIILH